MVETARQFLGRDDVDSVEAILADDSIDFGDLVHPTPARGEAIFTWDYERSRPGLAKLYEKAKTSQWNGSNDLDWSTPWSARISSAPRDLLQLGLWYTSRHSTFEGYPRRVAAMPSRDRRRPWST